MKVYKQMQALMASLETERRDEIPGMPGRGVVGENMCQILGKRDWKDADIQVAFWGYLIE